jgi:Sap, sulfolipid-1-addressing protein
MWLTLLVMAVAVSLEPFRIGMTVLMLNRPRPLRQLVAFLFGGFAMGVSVGLLVLFVLRPALLGSRHFTLPTVQIVIGVLALLVAAILATGVRLPGTDEEGRLATWGRRLANGSSLWVAALAGLGIALPSVDYLAALARWSPTWWRRTGRARRWTACTGGCGRGAAATWPRCWRGSVCSWSSPDRSACSALLQMIHSTTPHLGWCATHRAAVTWQTKTGH